MITTAPELIYMLKVNIGIALFYAFYKLFCCRDTFFQWRRIALLSFLALSFLYPLMDMQAWVKEQPAINELADYYALMMLTETNEEILKKVVADLKEAKRMLAQCDITEEHREWMAINPRMLGIDLSAGDIAEEDVFFAFRGYRMNYYAITAILARVYFWNGEYELAYNEAKEVLDATYDDDGQKCFSFMEYLELGNNMKDYNSIIMCFFNKTLQEDYEPFITKSSKDVFYLADFEKGEKELDQRLLEDMIGSERSNKYSRKYDIPLGTYGSDMIPGIRLSEMYYIMGEYFARTNNFIKAGEMLDEVRFNRGIITTNLKNTITTLDGYHTEMLKDMRKEFVGEGQLFFQYKRLDKKPAKNAIFVFEKPDNEDV